MWQTQLKEIQGNTLQPNLLFQEETVDYIFVEVEYLSSTRSKLFF
jgi:hypothetical protein